MGAIALTLLKKYWLYLILVGIIGGMGVAYKIKQAELNDANQQIATLKLQVTALNTTVTNLNGQIANLGNSIANQNLAINQLKADSNAKQTQLDALAKNLQILVVKQAATVKALEAATAPKTVNDAVTYLNDTLEGAVTWLNTMQNTSQ